VSFYLKQAKLSTNGARKMILIQMENKKNHLNNLKNISLQMAV